ncbi:G- coupled receptor Mth2 [Paramuricea clavata]|uniref:G- coupled receptor Mth2 n=1 Tax=Paramuricea clavata TaxID=317549 RepID=A0A7D9DY77_PARCT|nr:G- coupled receptor Mth2 [Paramuricea clavata]
MQGFAETRLVLLRSVPTHCFGNKTTFDHLGCYCDEACYKIFSDCCPDYEKQCGRQQLLEDKTSVWKCVEFEVKRLDCFMIGAIGVWMISKCPPDWAFDELKTKCENASLSFFGFPVKDFIPVVGAKNETYRNKHCALCNGVENHTSWDVEVFTNVTPPSWFDLDSKLKFIEDNGGRIKDVRPGQGQPWRFCFGRNFKGNCSSTNHSLYKACVEGPVEVVGIYSGSYFKNRACAECNGYDNIDSYGIEQSCARPVPPGSGPPVSGTPGPGTAGPTTTESARPAANGLNFVLIPGKPGVISTVREKCPVGTIYDTTLKLCRKGYIISSSGKLTNQFLVVLWIKLMSRRWITIYSTVENNFKSALLCRFWLQDKQISQITFFMQNRKRSLRDLVAATFRLTLTPFQSLLMANQYKSIFNVTNQNTAFLELLNFTGNFTLSWDENVLFVIKLTSKQLSCYDEKKFQSLEYKLDKENGSLVVNKTGKIFSFEDYTLIKEEDGNTTLCRKLLLSECNEGAFVPLSPDEYVVFPNLTVYYNATESVFNFGEYLISENKGTSNTSNVTQNSLLSSNSTISVCLPFKDTFIKTEKYSTNTTSYALWILTLIGFSVSIICLMLLLITYGLFQELRAVSGMNLMNLSLSLLLSHFTWLIGMSHFTETKTCTVLAIFEHYIFSKYRS